MRWIFSLVGLLAVVFIVGRLATQQLQAVAPAGTPPAAAAERAAAPLVDAMNQGAAARASDADGQ